MAVRLSSRRDEVETRLRQQSQIMFRRGLGAHVRGQNSLVEVLLAQEANKELSWVRVATQLCGVSAEAITIVGVGWRRILTCTGAQPG